jgi:hypothetical protein
MTLPEAIQEGQTIFAPRHLAGEVDGFEIWEGTNLLYASLGQPGNDPH